MLPAGEPTLCPVTPTPVRTKANTAQLWAARDLIPSFVPRRATPRKLWPAASTGAPKYHGSAQPGGRARPERAPVEPRRRTIGSPLRRQATYPPYSVHQALPHCESSTLQQPSRTHASSSVAASPANHTPQATTPRQRATPQIRYPEISDPIDPRNDIPRWALWAQRLLFFVLVLGANLVCVVTAFKTTRHAWVLGLLVFIKSKDILSTAAGVASTMRSAVHASTAPEKVAPQWILSLICAYAETEAQILKTIRSTIEQELDPHRQVICVILDGKPCPIRAHLTAVVCVLRRPYVTWQFQRGELVIYAGHIDGTPALVIEKQRNAGKKDSLILGHTLFNYPRDDAPEYLRLLREELHTHILPRIVGDAFPGFGSIFCTDADSTLHAHAMRRLANTLIHDRQAIAACGILLAELAGPEVEWATWHLFQQYQFVRRRAEDVWGRVTCLPGCITMIAVRPECAPALRAYAAPVVNRFLVQHQTQYLGTDRRLTWCLLSVGTHLRTRFVPDAVSETVAPQTLEHYLSQRRRWASNAYFNDLFYCFGPNQLLVTRLFALIDIVRLTLVFYRVLNTGVFLHGLVDNFYPVRIVPLLIVTKTPALWFALTIMTTQPALRRRMHKLFFGMCIDQIISPFLSVVIFVNVIFRMGSQVWGTTGVSTEAAPMASSPLRDMLPAHDWSPERLHTLVRDVVRSRRQDDAAASQRHSNHSGE